MNDVERRVRDYVTAVLRGGSGSQCGQVRRLEEGENHHVYAVALRTPDGGLKRVVVRVASSQRARSCVNAEREATVLAKLGGTGAPLLYDFRCASEWFDVPTMCIQYVEGQQRPPAAAEDFARLGRAVGRLHGLSTGDLATWLPPEVTATDYLSSRVAKTHGRLSAVRDPLPRTVQGRLRQALKAVDDCVARGRDVGAFRADDPLVLLHGDVAGGNVIWDPEPVLIDWEYARIGDAADEIAYIFNQNDCPESQRQRFWREYLPCVPRPQGDVVERVRWWEPVTVLGSAFFWVELWAQRADSETVGGADTAAVKGQDYYRHRTIQRLDRVDALLDRLET